MNTTSVLSATSRMAFAFMCAGLIAVSSFSEAAARGFGGYNGMMAGGSMNGRSAGYFGGQPGMHSDARQPGHGPGRWGGYPPRRIHHPIYGWGNPPISMPPAPVRTVSPKPHSPSNDPVQPPVPVAQRSRSGVPMTDEKRFVPNEVMFTVSGPAPIAAAIGERHHLVLISSHALALIGGDTMNRYRIADKRSVPDVIRDLETEQRVTWAQPNYIFKLEGVETAPQSLVSAQYALTKMHLAEAHRVTEGDKTLVAVIDSGIDANHSDIHGSVTGSFDAIGGEMLPHVHGTAIAAAISAHGALIGAAPHANVFAIRAFTGGDTKPGADGTTAHIIESLNWAYEHRAKIVNMSFAGAYDPLLALAIGTAHQKGMIIVAAAGNEGPKAAPVYPASDANVIAVTATDRNDKLLSAANHGAYICLAAPGMDILAAAPANSYQFSSGTSIAAAEISGVIALLLAEKPDLTADMVRQVLKDTADDIGGSTDAFGAGLGDAEKAIAAVDALRSTAAKVTAAKTE